MLNKKYEVDMFGFHWVRRVCCKDQCCCKDWSDTVSDPPDFGVFYLVKYYGGFIYFIPHAIKNWLKNVATLTGDVLGCNSLLQFLLYY
jgi:hypothetical protein